LGNSPIQILKKIVLGFPRALADVFLVAIAHDYSLKGTIKNNGNNKIQ
jgi:hypothetical protein